MSRITALTVRQEARRRRILDASTRLAAGGGFDAVQMREVAEESEVALGTLYRYFPSKIHLLVAVMQDQLGQLFAALAKTVVLVTHDIREAARLGRTITLMTAGRVVQNGTFADLVQRPATPFVRQFLTAQTLDAPAPAAR